MILFKSWRYAYVYQVALVLISIGTVFSWFEIEMPDYEVLKVLGKNVEIRRYDATKWASISTQGA